MNAVRDTVYIQNIIETIEMTKHKTQNIYDL